MLSRLGPWRAAAEAPTVPSQRTRPGSGPALPAAASRAYYPPPRAAAHGADELGLRPVAWTPRRSSVRRSSYRVMDEVVRI